MPAKIGARPVQKPVVRPDKEDDWMSDPAIAGLESQHADHQDTPVAPAPRKVLPVSYATPAGSGPWTTKQLQCRRLGLRIGLLGLAGVILPFFGLQLVILNVLGKWAIVGGFLLIVAGLTMFAGAYLIRTRAFGGPYAYLKIGGVSLGGALVLLVLLIGMFTVFFVGKHLETGAPVASARSTPVSAKKSSVNQNSAGTAARFQAAVAAQQKAHAHALPPGVMRKVHVDITGITDIPAYDTAVRAFFKRVHARGYWASRNSDHGMLDVTTDEDAAAIASDITFGDTTIDNAANTVNVRFDAAKAKSPANP
jgi:hypothetical protein